MGEHVGGPVGVPPPTAPSPKGGDGGGRDSETAPQMFQNVNRKITTALTRAACNDAVLNLVERHVKHFNDTN